MPPRSAASLVTRGFDPRDPLRVCGKRAAPAPKGIPLKTACLPAIGRSCRPDPNLRKAPAPTGGRRFVPEPGRALTRALALVARGVHRAMAAAA